VTETTNWPIKNSYTIPTGKWEEEKGTENIPPPNNLIQDSEGNEENGYSVLDSNKTKINDAKEPNDVHKNTLKEAILQLITENSMEMILDMVNQNVQEALKIFSRHQK
jgi:hypothetical protein